MKLANVFAAREAWDCVAQLKMRPSVAYKVLKYVRLVGAEFTIVEQQRTSMIYEITGEEPGKPVTIQPQTPEFAEYARRFGEVLETDSDLSQIDMTLEALVGSIDENNANSLTALQLSTLEPFFTT